MSKDPQIYEKISKSVASSIFGHPDIKKAVACLLFGGSPKRLPDGMRLRGDINVLLLGDPSTAERLLQELKTTQALDRRSKGQDLALQLLNRYLQGLYGPSILIGVRGPALDLFLVTLKKKTIQKKKLS